MSKKSLIKSASIISGATLLSRVLGFIRDILMARAFGTGGLVQAFFVSFKIPNMFRDLAGEGANNAAFVPVFSQYLATKSLKDFWRLVNTVFIAFVTVVTIITFICIVLTPLIVRLIAPGFIQDPEKLSFTIAITRPLLFYLVLVSIAAFVMGVLYTFKSFLASSLFPCVFNIVLIIAIMLADNSVSGIWKLVVAVIISGALQILIQLPSLFKQGFKLKPFEFQKNIFAHPGVRKIGRLLAPRLLGTAVYQLNIFVDTIFASLSFVVGHGAIAAIYYAERLIQFPLAIFGHSISNAALPTLSELSAKEQMDKFAQAVEFSLTNILFILIPSSLGLIILSGPIIKTIFERGEFTNYSTAITSTALAFYAVGLGAYGVNKLLALCFNSLHDTVTPVKVASLSLLSNIVLNSLFVFVFKAKIAGIAIASSISAVISAFILYTILVKRIGNLDTHRIINQLIRVMLASVIMALAIIIIQPSIKTSHQWLNLLITICFGLVVYIVASFYLKIYQVTHLLMIIVKIIKHK